MLSKWAGEQISAYQQNWHMDLNASRVYTIKGNVKETFTVKVYRDKVEKQLCPNDEECF